MGVSQVNHPPFDAGFVGVSLASLEACRIGGLEGPAVGGVEPELSDRAEKSPPSRRRLFSVVRGDEVGPWPSFVGNAVISLWSLLRSGRREVVLS